MKLHDDLTPDLRAAIETDIKMMLGRLEELSALWKVGMFEEFRQKVKELDRVTFRIYMAKED